MSLVDEDMGGPNTTTVVVPADPKKRAESVLMVFPVVVVAACVASTHANHFSYCVVEYIPMGFAICSGVGGYEDVLLRGREVVSTGEEACGRWFGRKESYCGEILLSEVLYKSLILKSMSER